MNSGAGDLFTDIRPVGSGTTTTNTGLVSVPRSDAAFPTASGGFWQGSTANGANVVLENNTSPGGPMNTNTTTSGACAAYAAILGETTSGRANALISYKANLVWNDTPQGAHGCTQVAVVTDNILSGANATNNTCWNCSPVTLWSGKDNQGTFYWFPMTGGTVPGAGDINAPPAFADPRRNISTYTTMRGFSPADYSGLLAHLALTTTDRGAEISRLRTYVRQGFTPMNVRLADASAPRGYHGAVKPSMVFGPINQ